MPDMTKPFAASRTHNSTTPIGRRVRVRYGSFTLVDTNDALLFHEPGRPPVIFVPRKHLPVEFLPDAGHLGTPRAGRATRYWHFSVGGRTAEDGVWSFERPQGALAEVAGYVAFDTTQVVLEIDGDEDDDPSDDLRDPGEVTRQAGHLQE